MNKPILCSFILIGGLMAPPCFAAEKTLRFDKGTVEVVFLESADPFTVTYTLPLHCLAEVVKKETGETTDFTHEGGACPQGAQFKVSVGNKSSVQIQLTNGVMRTPNVRSLLNAFANFRAKVSTGWMTSKNPAVSVSSNLLEGSHTARPAVPVSASATPKIELSVENGTMSLE